VNDRLDRDNVGAVLTRKDEAAFVALYDRHSPYLYRLALRLAGGDESAAEEMVHEAWVRAATRFSQFDWRSSLRTWLSGFVVNCRREALRDQPTVQLSEAHPAGTDESLEGLFDRVDLERAIAGLPAGCREVFILHDVEGWTHQGIAVQLGIEVGTSKSQLFRARAALRRALA
jgi:RNA polymerase sigma factor (sigma-70 family)